MKKIEYLELLNRKKIYSMLSNKLVEFVPSYDDVPDKEHGVYSAGVSLLDYEAGAEDDIQKMCFVPKDKARHLSHNMEDFFTLYQASEDFDFYVACIEHLIEDR